MAKKLSGLLTSLMLALAPVGALAQSGIDGDQPIEISADQLEVQQEQQLAIFSGNVVAVQGGITMKSARMIVHYSNAGNQQSSAAAKGISRIEADGGVFFTSATETARGSKAVYDVNAEQITMTGDVVLTREQNVLKGQQLVYNLKTGRSVLGAGSAGSGSSGGGRVKGLFVPGQ
jgi:lipopolysaccharide export system protein LptA